MDIEQRVVNPGFALLADDTFDTNLDESMTIAVTQAMVDEQYHTLTHLNASAVMRRKRGWRMPESALPIGYKARQYEQRAAAATTFDERALSALAFTTVAELSINAYLDLIWTTRRSNRSIGSPPNCTTGTNTAIPRSRARWPRLLTRGSTTTSGERFSSRLPMGWKRSRPMITPPGAGSWNWSECPVARR
jgi:hypothetical protein